MKSRTYGDTKSRIYRGYRITFKRGPIATYVVHDGSPHGMPFNTVVEAERYIDTLAESTKR
jgi:hypothetical protein